MKNDKTVKSIFGSTSSQAQQFISDHKYETLIEMLATRISEHHNYITVNELPICMDHAHVNEQIILSMSNKFAINKEQILHDLDPIITPLLNTKN